MFIGSCAKSVTFPLTRLTLDSEFFVRGIHRRELRATAARVRKIANKNLMSQIVSVSEFTDDHDA